jgi:hypothetical protein
MHHPLICIYLFFVMCQVEVALLYMWSYFVRHGVVLCLCVTTSIKNPYEGIRRRDWIMGLCND